MNLSKLKINKEFFIRYKIVLTCVLCTIFALLTPFWTGFRYFLYGSIFIPSLLFSFQDAFSLYGFMFFFTALSGVRSGTYYIWSLFLLGAILRYVYEVLRKKRKIVKYPLIMSIVFYLFSILPIWNYEHFFGIAITLLLLVPMYLIYVYRDELDVVLINRYMFAGLLASVIIGWLLAIILKIPQYLSIFVYSERLQGFTDNPNNIGFACILIITGFIISTIRRRQTWWTGVLCMSITIFVGAQTRSKAFMLTLFLLIFATFVILLFKNKKIAFISLASTAVVGSILFLCFRSYFNYMFGRFIYSGVISIQSVTTDRWDVWGVFLNEQFSSAVNVIFGMGAWTEIFLPYNVNTQLGCHSIYIEFFYYFGVVGIINLILLIFSYTMETRKKLGKVKLFVKSEDVLPLLMVLILGVGEMVIFNRKGVFLTLAILYILSGAKHIPIDSQEYQRIQHIKFLKSNKGEHKNGINK